MADGSFARAKDFTRIGGLFDAVPFASAPKSGSVYAKLFCRLFERPERNVFAEYS